MSWPSIDPGKLAHQITILQQTRSSDVSGTVAVWTPLLTTYAAIEPVRGTDIIRSGQATTQLFLTVTIRWQPSIQPNMRVQSNSGTYVIQSIENPGERNILLILNCLGLGANE
jgi:SPP1 family predicted phage head-tail adaptor